MKAKQNPIRVLHVLSLDTIGGVERIFQAYLRVADKTELEHHVLITRNRCHAELSGMIISDASSVSYVKYWHGIKLPRNPHFLRSLNLSSALRRISPDIILLYNCLGNLELFRAAHSSGGVVMYYERGAAWNVEPSRSMVRMLSEADAVLSCSCAARRMLELRWDLPQGRTRVLYNPIGQRFTEYRFRTKYLKGDRPLRFGTAGRLVSVKGMPVSINAVKTLLDQGVDCELNIAGEGPKERGLRSLVQQLGIGERVHFLGLVPDIEGFYDHIDIFLAPSIREPLGNVCLEANYAGCPVICAAVDGMPEVIVDGVTGYCIAPTLPTTQYRDMGGDTEGLPETVYYPSSDAVGKPKLVHPKLIESKVRLLLNDREVYASMSKAARKHACSFDIKHYVREFERSIRDAADQPKDKAR